MSNETEKNINEESEMNPTVRAVMAALNGSNGSDIGRVTRMMSATRTAAVAPSMIKEEEEIIADAQEDAPVFSDEMEVNDTLEVDIFEENGEIVGIDNGVLFADDALPGVEFVEKYRGANYVDDLINEAAAKTAPKKPATLEPVKIQSKKKVVVGGKIVNAPNKRNIRGAQSRIDADKAKDANAPKKPAAKPGAAKTSNTKATTKTPTAAEMAAQRKAREAADRAAMAKSADTAASDITKATEKVVADKTKQDLSTMKGGTVSKPSLLNRITGGRLGKGATYTPPTDSGSLGKFDKDFTKKVTDTAAEIKKKREDDEASLGPVEIKSKKKPKTPAAPPAPVEPSGGGDDEKPDFSGAGGGGGGSGARMPDEDSGYDETPTSGGGKSQPTTSSGSRKKIPIRFSIAGQGGVEREAYKKGRESGEIESQDVKFNVRNTKTGQMRAIKKGDPEYDAYYSRYKKMSQAVQEALLRMGAVLTEEGWTLNGELLESLYTEYAPAEMGSPYYYDSTGRLKIMSESEWTTLGLAEVILEKAIAEAMDKVGKEDEDIDNDGDMDKSDDYLHAKRKAIAAAIKGKK